MKQHTLRFESTAHRYFIDERPVRGVTEILKLAFGDPYECIPSGAREYALQLGDAVHRWTAADDRGTLNGKEPNTKQMRGYLAAWRRFKEEHDGGIIAIEQKVFSAKYQYAGTLDRVREFNGDLAILDIKTGMSVHPFAEIQTMAYKIAWDDGNTPKIKQRATVLLKQDGGYELKTYTAKTDKAVWFAALTVVNWKSIHNLKMEVEI